MWGIINVNAYKVVPRIHCGPWCHMFILQWSSHKNIKKHKINLN